MIEPSGLDGEFTMISFVREVIFDSTDFASTFQSGGSIEYGTGTPPASFANVGYEVKPGFGTRTSSPSFT